MASDVTVSLASGMDDDPMLIQYLAGLERRFAEATLRGDIASVEDLLAPEFIGVDPGGRELNRADVLGGLQSSDREIESLGHENIRVRVFGDCAVVFAVTVMRGRHNGVAFEGEFPYMRVWIKREGRWLAVATQSSGGR